MGRYAGAVWDCEGFRVQSAGPRTNSAANSAHQQPDGTQDNHATAPPDRTGDGGIGRAGVASGSHWGRSMAPRVGQSAPRERQRLCRAPRRIEAGQPGEGEMDDMDGREMAGPGLHRRCRLLVRAGSGVAPIGQPLQLGQTQAAVVQCCVLDTSQRERERESQPAAGCSLLTRCALAGHRVARPSNFHFARAAPRPPSR